MPNERQKMLAGELYDPQDPELVAARARARDLCQALNATGESEVEVRLRVLQELFGTGGAIILPGVRIGDRTVVGAGSVVTRDLPGGVFAAGDPCRVVREIVE